MMDQGIFLSQEHVKALVEPLLNETRRSFRKPRMHYGDAKMHSLPILLRCMRDPAPVQHDAPRRSPTEAILSGMQSSCRWTCSGRFDQPWAGPNEVKRASISVPVGTSF